LDHELKFTFPRSLTASASVALESLCRRDARFPANYVMSLYYDNRRLDGLADKVDSQLFKSKVRVRWYRELDGRVAPGGAVVERKQRLGTLRRKTRTPVPHPPGWLDETPLEDPELLGLPALLPADGREPSGSLFPVLIVRYLRRRFVEPLTGSRISLDTAISLHRLNRRLLGYLHPAPVGPTIVEVKNREGELPARLHCLQQLGGRLDSFSKYAVCFRAALAPRLGTAEA
jgi:hypothetical protein